MQRILVIDDEALVLNLVRRLLEQEGYEVRPAESGWEGLAAVSDFHPDLIICDIKMPNLDGYGVLEKLRADPLTETIPFIFLTGMSDRMEMRKGMEEGADDYLTKPFTKEELHRAVKTRIERQEAWKRKIRSSTETLRKTITGTLPHEMRTPLTGILAAASLLDGGLEGLDSSVIKKMTEIIRKSGERLNRTLGDFFLFHELEEVLRSAEALKIFKAARLARGVSNPSSLREAVSSAAVFAAKEAQREPDLVVELTEAPIRIDRSDLKAITEKLADNAFKYSAAGTPVHVKSAVRDARYVLSIDDRGRGLSADEISSIGAFVQFNRTYYEQQGMGLGLAIVKGLLRIYQGEMAIDSAPNRYTKIDVSIPCLPES